MRTLSFLCLIAFLTFSKCQNKYEEKFFTQKLDHFNQQTTDAGRPVTFQHRYLFSDTFWGKTDQYSSANCRGPIFFYTGNESPVTDYWDASGFFTEVLAQKYGALLIFAEHRYFGKSIPFPDDPWSPGHIGFLSAGQALADYVDLIFSLKSTLTNASNCPVFSFGGSYGGMLSTWFRIKYPHVVMGALAASAPFNFLGSGISPYAFTTAASFTYEDAAPGCSTAIYKGLNALVSLVDTQEGRTKLAKEFILCNQSLPTPDDAWELIEWAQSGLLDQAMLDYPYPTDYGIPLPAWPVNQTCTRILSQIDKDPVAAIAFGIGIFYNATGDKKCYDIETDIPDFGVCCGWSYLACTEVYLPYGQNGTFLPSPFNVTNDITSCKDTFGVTLDPYLPYKLWGSFDSIKQSSKIIFSNGLLDPWHTSGVLHSLSDDLIAIVIPAAAHHLDLRLPNDQDPVYVRQARTVEDLYIGKWILEFFGK